MPEGDTVWLAAQRMSEAFAGTTLRRAEFRVAALALVDLVGARVVGVQPRGKRMLTRLDRHGERLTLHTHFRMDGSWRLMRTADRGLPASVAGRQARGGGPARGGGRPGRDAGRPAVPGPAHHIRVVLGNDHWTAYGMRLHDVVLLPTEEEPRLVGHLGPDVLGADWDVDDAARRILARPDREIGPALLDQRNLAGVGNLYKTEVLYLRGLSPWTRAGSIPDLGALLRLAHRLMVANRDRWEQTTTGNTRRGEDHWVFERQGLPCRRCGTQIHIAEQGDPPYARLSYWCPRCQPGLQP